MTSGHENAVPADQAGHGANEISIQSHFDASQGSRQREKLLAYLIEHGHITTLGARADLAILAPAARIWELRHEDGHHIITFRDGRRVARYVLMGLAPRGPGGVQP